MNASLIVKPDAIEQLTTDLQRCDIDIAIISESHVKKKRVSSCINIEGYELFRRDRNGRKGGGVVIFSRQSLAAAVWSTPGIDPVFELMRIKIPNAAATGDTFVRALYQPPAPLYKTSDLLDHIEAEFSRFSRISRIHVLSLLVI